MINKLNINKLSFFKLRSQLVVSLIPALVLLTVVCVHDRVFQGMVRILHGLGHHPCHCWQHHGESRSSFDGGQVFAGQAGKLHETLLLSEHGAHDGGHLFSIAGRRRRGRLLVLYRIGPSPSWKSRIDCSGGSSLSWLRCLSRSVARGWGLGWRLAGHGCEGL